MDVLSFFSLASTVSVSHSFFPPCLTLRPGMHVQTVQSSAKWSENNVRVYELLLERARQSSGVRRGRGQEPCRLYPGMLYVSRHLEIPALIVGDREMRCYSFYHLFVISFSTGPARP